MYTKLLIRSQMRISPQLVMNGRLLQLPAGELKEFVQQELLENPALALVGTADRRTLLRSSSPSSSTWESRPGRSSIKKHSYSSSQEAFVENIAARCSPFERLSEQASLLFEKEHRNLVITLLEYLDPQGYLVTPLEQLTSELHCSSEEILQGIKLLHQLEPSGIGARDIRECFLLQCDDLESRGTDCHIVRRVLTVAWDEFLNQQWHRVAKKIQESKQVVQETCEFMRRNLYPYPLAVMDISHENNLLFYEADLVVLRNDQSGTATFSLEIPGEQDFELRTSDDLQTMLATPGEEQGLSASEKGWIKSHVDRAGIFIHALKQRWETLRRIGEYLLQTQQDFIERGPLHLRSITRAMIAKDLNLHESTISRAVQGKIMQLPSGQLIPLSDFFDSSLAVKAAIRLLLRETQKQMCDREIAEGLRAKGVNLSRRTITKYRREIAIGPGRPQSTAI